MAGMNALVWVALIGALAGIGAFYTKAIPPTFALGGFFGSLVLAVAVGASSSPGKGGKAGAKGGRKATPPKKKAAAKEESSPEGSDSEEEKEIGLSVDPSNVLPQGSRRASKIPEKFNDSIIPAKSLSAIHSPAKAKAKSPGKKKDSDIFIVDRIVDKRVFNDQNLYLVKWKGYNMDQATWEPIKNLNKVMDMVEEYEEAAEAQNKAPAAKRRSTAAPKAAPTPKKSAKTAKATPSKAPAKEAKERSESPVRGSSPARRASPPPAKSPAPKRSTRKSVAPAKSPAKKTPAKKEASPKKGSPVKTRRSTRGN